MDIYDYLKLDHAQVDRLFKQFEDTDSKIRQQQIVALIAQELFVHAESEQDTFYKALENYDSSKEEAQHGRKEHQEIEELITMVANPKKHDSVWVKNVEKLKDLVEHHVKEEEGSIFDHAKEVLSGKDAYALKEKMHYLKGQLLAKFDS